MNMKFWGIFIATYLLLVACQSSSINNANTSISNCIEISHALGKTCVPERAKRLVTLNLVALESAVTLGINPIGSVRANYDFLLAKYLEQTESLGLTDMPNLEKIVTLKPDLILSLDLQPEYYQNLKTIAPTVLIDFDHSGQWQSAFLEMAKALNKATEAQELLNKYRQRLSIFKDIKDQEISVIRAYPDRIRMYLQDSFIGTILKEARFKRPQSQRVDAKTALQSFGNPIQVDVNQENISQIDGDVIFLFTAESIKKDDQAATQQLENLKKDPLWQELKAVKNGKVFLVPSYWIGSGLITANAVVDDLNKYLIDAKQ